MKKNIFIFFMVGIFALTFSGFSFAMMCGSHGEHGSQQKTAQSDTEHKHIEASGVNTQTNTQEAVNVGNKICPVSGEKIDEKTKATYEYKGKIYNFCCPVCVEDFKKDPEKYIQKVEEELKEAESKELQPQEPETSSHGMHEGHQH